MRGYCKGFGYLPGDRVDDGKLEHEWNCVRVDGAWRPVDCCWGAGYLRDGTGEFVPSPRPLYCLPDPDIFVRDHFSIDAFWQLLPEPMTLEDFQACANVKYGLTHHNIELVNHKCAVIGATKRCRVLLRFPQPMDVRCRLWDGSGRNLGASVGYTLREDGVSVDVKQPCRGRSCSYLLIYGKQRCEATDAFTSLVGYRIDWGGANPSADANNQVLHPSWCSWKSSAAEHRAKVQGRTGTHKDSEADESPTDTKDRVCPRAPVRSSPGLPAATAEEERDPSWGPTRVSYDLGIQQCLPVSTSITFCKTDRPLCVRYRTSNPHTQLKADLHRIVGESSSKLDNRTFTNRTVNGEHYIMIVNPGPTDGSYVLEVHARSNSNEHFQLVAKYKVKRESAAEADVAACKQQTAVACTSETFPRMTVRWLQSSSTLLSPTEGELRPGRTVLFSLLTEGALGAAVALPGGVVPLRRRDSLCWEGQVVIPPVTRGSVRVFVKTEEDQAYCKYLEYSLKS